MKRTTRKVPLLHDKLSAKQIGPNNTLATSLPALLGALILLLLVDVCAERDASQK